MKTKLLSFTIFLLLLAPPAFCQSARNANTGISFGILGGIGLQNLNGTDFWGEKLDNKLILGYHGGANVTIPIAPDFFLQPGLLFSVKGAKKEIIELPSKGEENKVTTKISLSYIEVPVYLLYRPQLGNGHILLGIGPYAAYGIAGNVKTTGGSLTNETKVRFKDKVALEDPSTYAYYRALDAGLNISAGYELYNGIFLQLNTQLGFLKVNPEYELLSNDKTTFKNTGFGISAGYRF